MFKKALILSGFVFTMLTLAGTGNALADQAPFKIPYQGLLQLNGNPLNTTMSIRFKLSKDAGGANVLWQDTFQVEIANGHFSVVFGDQAALPVEIGNLSEYYLEIILKPDTPEATALSPRQRLLPALNAQTAFQGNNFSVTGTLSISDGRKPQGEALGVYINGTMLGINTPNNFPQVYVGGDELLVRGNVFANGFYEAKLKLWDLFASAQTVSCP